MSLQQNINNSIYSLAHLNLLRSVSKDSKEMSQLFKDINDGKYAMTPEEVKKAEKSRPKVKDLKKAEKELLAEKKLEEEKNLMNEINGLRTAKPKLTADEAELLARENIAKKQAEYEKSREIARAKYEKKFAKNLERAHKHGKLGF